MKLFKNPDTPKNSSQNSINSKFNYRAQESFKILQFSLKIYYTNVEIFPYESI